MKPAWEALGSSYASSSSVIIGDVDCTVHSELCQTYGVQGYPTIKFFKDGDQKGTPYQGGRDEESLKKFTREQLEVQCNVADGSGCSEKETAFIEKYKDASAEDLEKQTTRLQDMRGKSMKQDLAEWVTARINILTQLAAAKA